MKYYEVSELYGSPKELIMDVPTMITNIIIKALQKCRVQERVVDWEKLKEYIMEFFLVADYRAEDCIKKARCVVTL